MALVRLAVSGAAIATGGDGSRGRNHCCCAARPSGARSALAGSSSSSGANRVMTIDGFEINLRGIREGGGGAGASALRVMVSDAVKPGGRHA